MRTRFVYPEGKSKALTMSYDDGVVADRRLVEIFNRYGIKGTFHLNSATFGTKGKIDPEEVATLYKGHEVSCHAATHPFLERIPRGEVMREVWEDRKRIEELAGYPVLSMSYPYGTYNDEVVEILRSAGIHCCRTTAATKAFGLPNEFLAWHPTCHHRDALALVPNFLNIKYPLGIFFVWGHAYEFDNNNNWQDIESFCQQMAGKEDIWYATNIEIYDYVQAYNCLRFAADGHLVENPTHLTLWIAVNGKTVSVAPGETKNLDELLA